MSIPSLTAPAASPETSRRLPTWLIPWLFVPPFLLMLFANGMLVYYAFTSFSGLTSKHASAEGANYNAAIAAARAQAERGWQVTSTFTNPHGLEGVVGVRLLDRESRPLTGAEVSVKVMRPTSAGADQVFPLKEIGNGQYQTEMMLRMPGVWDLSLMVRHPTGTWQKIERVMVKG
ncbi:MAG: FixH family protein [Rhodospirillaceae bacterium]